MQAYLTDIYQNSQAIAEAGKDNHFTSSIYQEPLKQVPYQMENYLLSSAKNALKSNEYLAGIGAMFEPKMFAGNIDSYAFYMTPENMNSAIEPYGDYSDYSKESFYSDAAAERITKVLQPYDYQGKTLVTISKPVIYNNILIGVVMADIDLSKFQTMEMDQSRYSSLYAVVIDDNMRLIYDTRSTDSIIDKSVKDTAGEKNAKLIEEKASASNGNSFSITYTTPAGKTVHGIFSPIEVGGESW